MSSPAQVLLYFLLAAAAGPAHAGETGAGPAAAALKASPDDREALLRAVEFLPDGALAADMEISARRLLDKSPSDHAGYLGLCKALRGSARPQEAVANCRRSLELAPTDYPPYRELALAFAAAGEKAKARETLEQAVELSSASYRARYDLAGLLERAGEPAAALPHYRRAAALAAADKGPDGAYYAALAKGGARRTEAAKKAKSAARPKPAAAAGAAAQAAPRGDAKTGAACLEKFKSLPPDGDPAAGLAQADACLKQLPASAELAAGRAPLLVRLGRYEDGVKEYERAAGLYASDKAMAAFCRVKAAETWLKLGAPAKASAQYRLALAANPADLNALRGLAAAQETVADLKGAAQTYEAILKAQPSDARARTRLEELRAAVLTDGQVLEELRLRQAVPEGRTALLPEDSKLFKAIFAAELGGGVDYVKRKAPSAKGLITERKAGAGPRLLLTGAGYKAYVSYASRDAVKFFEEEGVGLREIFQLRTLAGQPVFDPAGKLTREGEDLWRNSARGQKTWLLPFDPLPSNPQAARAAQDITAAEKEGYREISESEYLWLLKATTCPDGVLKDPPVSAREFDDGARRRYLLCYVPNSLCWTDENSKLPAYIEQYRSGDLPPEGGPAHSGFFGGPGAKKRKFCENGAIWRGP